jgi:Ca2+-binding EF-hand superfamily protein
MKSKTRTLLALPAILLTLSLQAQTDGDRLHEKGNRPNPEQLFAKLDADQNGSISQEEAKGPLAKHFDRIDQNSDGSISREEHTSIARKMRERQQNMQRERANRLEEMDINGNGSISKEEAGERLAKRFEEIDSDGDGELTKEEMRTGGMKMRAKKDIKNSEF